MTVKVIQMAKAKRVECGTCGALLEYRQGDATQRNYTACGSSETRWPPEDR